MVQVSKDKKLGKFEPGLNEPGPIRPIVGFVKAVRVCRGWFISYLGSAKHRGLTPCLHFHFKERPPNYGVYDMLANNLYFNVTTISP